MKKLLSLFFALLLVFSLTACGIDADIESDLSEIENILNSMAEDANSLLDQAETGTDALSEGQDAFESISQNAESISQEVEEMSSSIAEEIEALETIETSANSSTDTESTESPIDIFVTEPTTEAQPPIDEDGCYTTKEDVALYIHTYGKLPKNFITKSEARSLGWEGGSLEPYAPGKCIGGDYFGNYEGLLPTDRKYTECDIDTLGARSRGAKRIVFSADGLIYYTDDHYESFTLLYGEE